MVLRDSNKSEEKDLTLEEKIYQNELKCMFFTEDFSDFEFLIDGQKIKAHKAVIAARTELFASKAFDSNEKNMENEVATVADVFRKFLIYLYSEHLPENAIDFVADFLYLAEKYFVDGLKEKCEEILEENMNDSTSILAYKMAYRYNLSEDLIRNSFKFIKK